MFFTGAAKLLPDWCLNWCQEVAKESPTSCQTGAKKGADKRCFLAAVPEKVCCRRRSCLRFSRIPGLSKEMVLNLFFLPLEIAKCVVFCDWGRELAS